MKFSFDPSKHLILVWANLHGPEGMLPIRMAIDTGATRTCLTHRVLKLLDYDIDAAVGQMEIGTGNGTIRVPSMPIQALRCLGRTTTDFTINWLVLPEKSGIDGLLGLDFLRGRKFQIDFEEGTVELD